VLTPSSAASEPATAAAWNSTSGTSAARPGATGSASATTAAAQSGATPGPSASPSSTASAAPRSYFLDHRVVAFYGNPLSPILGILGDGEPEQVVTRLRAQADAYARLDSTRQVTPALELIEAVAQDTPTDNGLYLYYTEPGVVDHFAGLAADNNMLLILDEQIGRSSPDAETRRMLPRLASPLVGLALDPEFEMKPGEVPGRELGSIDAAEINSVQAMLEELAVRQGLPSKLLIIHQFQLDMITHLDQLRRAVGEVVTRDSILSAVWGYHFDPRSNVVDVCVGRLRKKLGEEAPIETVRHAGYRLAVA